MRPSIGGMLLTALGVLIVVTPWYIFPVCEMLGIYAKSATGMNMIMPCGYTARAELGVGSLLAICGAILMVTRTLETRRAIAGVSVALGALAVLFPTAIIGMCLDPDSPCRVGTQPALVLLGGVTIIISLYLILRR